MLQSLLVICWNSHPSWDVESLNSGCWSSSILLTSHMGSLAIKQRRERAVKPEYLTRSSGTWHWLNQRRKERLSSADEIRLLLPWLAFCLKGLSKMDLLPQHLLIHTKQNSCQHEVRAFKGHVRKSLKMSKTCLTRACNKIGEKMILCFFLCFWKTAFYKYCSFGQQG